MRIQHNIMAMNAYNNYRINTTAVSKNLEKLSSGYKINRAGDDAAGLAISEKMRAQITGLDAAGKNVKDGISLVKTAEGAMQEVQDMLNRMVYLATQSANGTYDNDIDRANLQKEVDQLQSEINRIADSANFNGIKLLDGSQEIKTEYSLGDVTATAAFTVKADGKMAAKEQAGVYTIDFTQLKGKDGAGTITNTSTADKTAAFVIGDQTYTVTLAGGSSTDIAQALADEINKTAGTTNKIHDSLFKATAKDGVLTLTMSEAPTDETNKWVTAEPAAITIRDNLATLTEVSGYNQGEQFGLTTVTKAISASGRLYGQAEVDLSDASITGDLRDGAAIQIGDTTYTFAIGANSKFKDAANVIDLTSHELTDLTDSPAHMGLVAEAISTAAMDNKNFFVGWKPDGVITLTEKDGGVDYAKNNLAGPTVANKTDGDWTDLVKFGSASINGRGLTLQIGDTSDDFNQLKVSIGDIHTDALGISKINIGNQQGASDAINVIKNAINTVSSIRGTLGATQNRLEHTQNNLAVMKENIQDAESTIRDTDIAEEMMSYTKNNILVQSAQAMLAQANQIPQGVLQLLG